MDVAYRLSWGIVYQEIEKMCMSNSLVQVCAIYFNFCDFFDFWVHFFSTFWDKYIKFDKYLEQ